jgi:hypothetical protein
VVANNTFGNFATKAYVDTGLANRNKIINGAMAIDQRNAGASGTAIGVYTVDRWKFGATQVGKGSWQQWATGAGGAGGGFSHYLGFISSSAYTLIAADNFNFLQTIEAENFAESFWGSANALPATLSFWAMANNAGTYGGAVGNVAGTRSYPFSFSLPASVWTYVMIPIPGDTTGTWVLSGNVGACVVRFGLGAGSTFSGPAGAWASAQYVSANGAFSVVGTNGAAFNVTGVQFEFNSTATPFERRSIGTELALCQRYFQRTGFQLGGYNNAAGTIVTNSILFPPMRAAPTVAQSGMTFGNASAAATNPQTASSVTTNITSSAAGIAWASGTLSLDAEL